MTQKQNSDDSVWNDISVVIVTYNSSKVIESCLEPLKAAAKIIIVDNASSDETCRCVKNVSTNIEIIQNAKNIGYGAAMNLGMSNVDTPYGLAITPDVILQNGAIEALVKSARVIPEPAAVCPYLHNGKGKSEISIMGPHELHHRELEEVISGDFCTWFVTGATLLYQMKAWREIGGFDETIFLYSEDNDLALRTTQKGYSMVITADAEAIHVGGASSLPSPRVTWLRNWHMTWSHLYILGKHVDRRVAKTEATQLAVKYGFKSLFYWLIFRWMRAKRDGARFSACLSFLFRPMTYARQSGEQ